jgi:hypothetical protein
VTHELRCQAFGNHRSLIISQRSLLICSILSHAHLHTPVQNWSVNSASVSCYELLGSLILTRHRSYTNLRSQRGTSVVIRHHRAAVNTETCRRLGQSPATGESVVIGVMLRSVCGVESPQESLSETGGWCNWVGVSERVTPEARSS